MNGRVAAQTSRTDQALERCIVVTAGAGTGYMQPRENSVLATLPTA